MFDIFNVIVPVFAIIGVGYMAVRLRLFPSEGTKSLVAFVNNFATPCLLCQAMLTSDFLHVPIEFARYGILLAAMPAGINVYVFATYYDRAVNVAANVVLISTVASIATITFWLYVLGH